MVGARWFRLHLYVLVVSVQLCVYEPRTRCHICATWAKGEGDTTRTALTSCSVSRLQDWQGLLRSWTRLGNRNEYSCAWILRNYTDFTIIVANLASNTSSMESQIFILRDDQTLLASATSEEAEDYRVYPNFAKSGFFFFFALTIIPRACKLLVVF